MYRWSVFAGAAETKRVWEFSVHLSNVVFIVGFAFGSGFFNLFRLMVVSFNTVTAISCFFFVCIFLLIPLNIIWHNLSLSNCFFLVLMNRISCLSFILLHLVSWSQCIRFSFNSQFNIFPMNVPNRKHSCLTHDVNTGSFCFVRLSLAVVSCVARIAFEYAWYWLKETQCVFPMLGISWYAHK